MLSHCLSGCLTKPLYLICLMVRVKFASNCCTIFQQMRLRDVSIPPDSLVDKPEEKVVDSMAEFCIDAGATGNLARFINHSCEPNLFVQCVLSSHHDVKLARVMLFAADNIPPLQVTLNCFVCVLHNVLTFF